MERKNIAATVTTILCALLFIVIGACFSAFVYKREVIEVKNPSFILASGINVYDENGDKSIESLELSKMKLGLKPATGEEDSVTHIPTTITDKQGSEGQYAKFKLYAPSGARISVVNVKIQKDEKEQELDDEKENIFVAIKEIEESAVSLEGENIVLGTVEASEDRKLYTFFVWLGANASDKLESSIISFDISIQENIT